MKRAKKGKRREREDVEVEVEVVGDAKEEHVYRASLT